MLIVGGASAFAWVLTRERIPQQLTTLITSNIHNKYLFLLIVIVFLLLVGMFIEGNAAMIVLVPLLAPVAAAYGIDEIHFAMLFILLWQSAVSHHQWERLYLSLAESRSVI